MSRKNVFVLGLNAFNRAKLQSIHDAERYEFVGVLEPALIYDAIEFDMPGLLSQAEARIAAHGGPVDAIVGYIDFPVSTMLPLLCRRFGARGPSLESLLKCEHKYWSRLEQRRVVPEHIPRFCAFDPFADDPLAQIDLPFPFWVKPIKASGSHLGFRIADRGAFERALPEIRARIGNLGEPFNYVLQQADLPPEVADIDGHFCIAESLIGGRQCTVEGYCQNGRAHVHGIVDSIRLPNRSSFARYQYPSRLPPRVRRRMTEITARFLEHVGYDDAAFNVELFWQPKGDHVWLLEVNTRVAQHHSELFEKVGGVSNHEVAVEVALGSRPRMPETGGEFTCAAAFFLRTYADAFVEAVPSEAWIAAVAREVPGTVVDLHVSEGMWLSELPEQDSYSYYLAIIYVGAHGQRELLRRYRRVVERLPFRLSPRVPRAA